MELADVVAAERREPRATLLRLAGAVEDASEHPIARAIAERGARASSARCRRSRASAAAPGSASRRSSTATPSSSAAALLPSGRRAPRRSPSARRGGVRRRRSSPRVGRRRAGCSRRRPGQADQRARRSRELRALGLDAGAPDRRQRARPRSASPREVGIERVLAERASRGQGRRGPAAAGGGRGRRHGRRRRQRRARARPGRPRPRDRHRHRRRDRGLRPDARLRRPARRRRRDPARPPHPAHDQGQPLLGVRLQRRRDPARRRRPARTRSSPPRRWRPRASSSSRTACACAASTAPRGAAHERRPTAHDPRLRRRQGRAVKRLHRIEGQVRGIERMVEDDRYCIDILTQIARRQHRARDVAVKLLDDHVSHCVAGALASGDADGRPRRARACSPPSSASRAPAKGRSRCLFRQCWFKRNAAAGSGGEP